MKKRTGIHVRKQNILTAEPTWETAPAGIVGQRFMFLLPSSRIIIYNRVNSVLGSTSLDGKVGDNMNAKPSHLPTDDVAPICLDRATFHI